MTGASVSGPDNVAGPGACISLTKATANCPGSDRTTVPRNEYRGSIFASCGSVCKKKIRRTSVPAGRPRSERKSAPPAETFHRSEQECPVPALPRCSQDGSRKIQGKSFVFSHQLSGSRDQRCGPLPAGEVPSPSCRQAHAAVCTLSAADIRDNTNRIRNYYGKRLVMGRQERV